MQSTDNQKEQILQVASRKMMTVGVRSVSIDDICQDLGISKKTFYVYFDSKESLVKAFLEDCVEKMKADGYKICQNMTIVKMAVNSVKFLDTVNDVHQVPVLVYDLQKYYPKQMDEYHENVRQMVNEFMVQFLSRGIEEGFFRPDIDVPLTARIFSALHRIMVEKVLASRNHPTIFKDTKYALDIFFRGLVSDQGKQMVEQELSKRKK